MVNRTQERELWPRDHDIFSRFYTQIQNIRDMTTESVFDPIKHYVPTQDMPARFLTVVPATGVTFGFGNTIRFELPAQGFAFLNSLALMINVQLRTTGSLGRNLAFPNDIGSIFESVRLLHGRTVVLDDIQQFGGLQSLLADIEEPLESYIGGTGILKGVGYESSQTAVTQLSQQRVNYISLGNNTANNSPGWAVRRFLIRPRMGFFRGQKPLPLKHLGEQIVIEFKIHDSFKKAFYSLNAPVTGLSTSFEASPIILEVGRPMLKVRIETSNPLLDKRLVQSLKQRTLQYQWDSIYFQRLPLSLFNQNQTLIINCSKRRVKYAFAVIKSDNDFNLQNVAQNPNLTYSSLDPRDTVGTSFDNLRRTSLRTYQWIYNNRAYPHDPVDVMQLTVDPPSSAGTFTPPLASSTTNTMGSSAADAYYQFEETMRGAPFHFNQGFCPGRDGLWQYFDRNLSSQATQSVSNSASTTQTAVGTIPTKLVMTGNFNFKSATGNHYVLDTKSLNAPLQLQLNFNGTCNLSETNSNQAPGANGAGGLGPSSMFVDCWVFYDCIWTLGDNGLGSLDQ